MFVPMMCEREKFFRFFFRFSFSSFSFIRRHFFFFEVEDNNNNNNNNNNKMIFNLEGLTVYFPYEYLYPVRFKQVDFFYCYSVTIFFVALLSLCFRIRARIRRRKRRRRIIIIIIIVNLLTTHIITIIGTIRIHDRTETRVGR